MPLNLTYEPAASGGWLALCSPKRVLVIESATDAALTAALQAAVRDDGGIRSVLDLLAANGLAAIPPFALLEVSGGPRVIVRGDVSVRAVGPNGESAVTGAGVTTWTEQALPDATLLSVSIDGASAAAVGALPIVVGTAWVAGLTISISGADAAAPMQSVSAQPTSAQPPSAHPNSAKEALGSAAPEAGDASTPLAAANDHAPSTTPAPVIAESSVTDEPDPEATVSELPEGAATVTAPDTGSAAQTDKEPASAERGRYDDLFGDTMYRDVAAAAVAEEPEASAGDEPQASVGPVGNGGSVDGDHDGQTVLTSDIAKLRKERKERKSRRGAPSAPTAAPAPSVVLTLPNGSREPLAQPILVGRAPSVTQISGGQVPRLITVGTADQDISRTHARFVLEGETVVVTDLHSRNGTMVVLPGKEPQKLRAGEPTAIIVGTVVDFGGGITLRVDED